MSAARTLLRSLRLAVRTRRARPAVARGLGALLAAGALVASLGAARPAAALGQSLPGPFTLVLSNQDFAPGEVQPIFSLVRSFTFELDFAGPLSTGGFYTNDDLTEVRYSVNGRLADTPSGFPAFALNRFPGGEGPISPADWVMQQSRVSFLIAKDAQLYDGVQLSELVASDKDGAILRIDAREIARLDRARYHPPILELFADGTGRLSNSRNSSKDTGTTNPGTGLEVDVFPGDEYVTNLVFDPAAITVIDATHMPPIPEPGTALLLGLGLVGLAATRRR